MKKSEMIRILTNELEIRGWNLNRDFYAPMLEDALNILLEYGMQPPATRVVEEDIMGDSVIRVKHMWEDRS